MESSSSLCRNGTLILLSQHSSFTFHRSAVTFKWGLRRDQDASQITHRTKRQAFQVLANPNASGGKRGFYNEVIMVDPLEAKRLAAKQMQQIQAKEKFKRQRRIEAINGAWAMIGLTAGLVIEGHTGNSFLAQLAGYWGAIFSFFVR